MSAVDFTKAPLCGFKEGPQCSLRCETGAALWPCPCSGLCCHEKCVLQRGKEAVHGAALSGELLWGKNWCLKQKAEQKKGLFLALKLSVVALRCNCWLFRNPRCSLAGERAMSGRGTPRSFPPPCAQLTCAVTSHSATAVGDSPTCAHCALVQLTFTVPAD